MMTTQNPFRGISTPALLLDLHLAKRNYERLATHLLKNGLNLRVHVKTCKSVELIRQCSGIMHPAITVSTLAEAEHFARAGFTDILYCVGITPEKLARVKSIASLGAEVKIVLDNLEIARQIRAEAKRLDLVFSFLMEIDCDGHRSGVAPDCRELLEIVQTLTQAGHRFMGVATHAGSAYELPVTGAAAFRTLARIENEAVTKAASALAKAGFPSAIVSAGSTPTAIFGQKTGQITEIRAGAFVFQDCVMASMDVCGQEDMALSVLCQIIGKRRRDGALVVDAGWAALSGDAGSPVAHNQFGYGIVADLAGKPIENLRVAELNQEHGIIPVPQENPDLRPGGFLRIFPMHACATAQMFQYYTVFENGQILGQWPRCSGW